LLEIGIIDEVVRPLLAGKEAQIYLVWAQGEQRVAKVYREAQHRSFRQRSQYTEGRRVRNTRDQRAMSKRSSYGRAKDEEAWRSAEVDVIYRLQAAGVRVPRPFDDCDGVLVMELVTGTDGLPAPQLAEVNLDPKEGHELFRQLLHEVVKMLSTGVVHGDLSDFNVLMSHDGPVLIDFPQAVDPTANRNARRLLIRDVDNLLHFFRRFLPHRHKPHFGEGMWAAYEMAELTPDYALTGRFKPSDKKADVRALLRDLKDEEAEVRARAERRAETPMSAYARRKAARPKPSELAAPEPQLRRPRRQPAAPAAAKGLSKRSAGGRSGNSAGPQAAGEAPARSKRRRRRRRRGGSAGGRNKGGE
jgi:RIO kinase 1